MKVFLSMVAATIAWLATSGCAAQARSPEPVPIDRAECARCGMLISTEEGAAQIISPGEDTRFFDDVACLAAAWQNHPAAARAFVRLHGGIWADVESTSFARPRSAHTAMGSGIVAFATLAEARAADRDGRSFSWDDVRRLNGESR